MMRWIKIILGTITVIVVIMILEGNSVGAAHFVNQLAGGVKSFAHGFSTFVGNLNL